MPRSGLSLRLNISLASCARSISLPVSPTDSRYVVTPRQLLRRPEWSIRDRQPRGLRVSVRDCTSVPPFPLQTSSVATTAGIRPRLYLSDAIFVVALGGELHILEHYANALKRPQYPLFLGRRSCPANPDLVLGIRKMPPAEALRAEAWHADDAYRKTQPLEVALPIHRDAAAGEHGDRRNDIPVNFSQEQRLYTWRDIVQEEPTLVVNGVGRSKRDSFFEAVAEA